MNEFNKINPQINNHLDHMKGAASHLVNEGKKLVDDLCADGREKINLAQKKAEDYSDDLIEHVRAKPLKSLLISAGIGFLVSVLLSK